MDITNRHKGKQKLKIDGVGKVLKRFDFCSKPTRIIPLTTFSSDFSVHIKCDDETGFLLSGNKIRKLEYYFHEISEKSKGKKEVHVFTCGGIQSNHARATAVCCRRSGYIPHLILRGSEPIIPDGNMFINNAVDADIKWITREEWKDRAKIMENYSKKFENEGKNYCRCIPSGASDALGSWGYVEVINEILEQTGMENFPKHIFVATGSGGTAAGLVIGVEALKVKTKIWSIAVCDDAKYFHKEIKDIITEFNKDYGFKVNPEPSKEIFEIVDEYIGPGYSIPYKEELDMMKKLARNEGIILDPCYTGKAFYGMTQILKEMKKTTEKETVLFIHTGGVFGQMGIEQLKRFHDK